MSQLDITKKQDVQYAVPIWLRDEQIKQATVRVKERLEPLHDRRSEPIAVVGYGPSLKETWEEIRKFKFVITCSGSHKFLIERGIIPTWHVEVDPRDHKIGLLGPPHPDVTYLPASTCHPKYFDHLEGFKVKLWHIFDGSKEGLRQLPAGEWAVTGGCDAGLRAMTIAGFLGFRELHVFGIDGSAPAHDATRHAGEHPKSKAKYDTVDYNGRQFFTTPGMLEAARQTPHEFDQMPAVRAKFYGDGLTQTIMDGYKWKDSEDNGKPFQNVVGYCKPELISATYRELNSKLHESNLAYGVGGGKHANTVIKLAKKLNTNSILDYGAGKGYLAKALPFPIWEYDPAIPEKSESPRPADLVICTDVLEHIEPEKLAYVLDDIRRCTLQVAYFVIHTGPSTKTLADGRNSHLIQQPAKWWKKRLRKFFDVPLNAIMEHPPLVHVVAGTKKQAQ